VGRELAIALSTELRDVLEPLLQEIESLNERIPEYFQVIFISFRGLEALKD
jgi:hypothetical protein